MNQFAPFNNPPTKITLSLSKVILIFLYHIPMLCTLFAIPLTAILRLEGIAYTLTQKSVFHFLAMYTLLQIYFYPHKVQFLSVDYPPHSSIHVRNNGHTSAFAQNPDVSNLRFFN